MEELVLGYLREPAARVVGRTRSGDCPVTAITVLRMTRATWYKHRFSVVGIPAVFLLAALALFADGAVQRHWLSVHHLSGCLVANATTGGSWCAASAAWVSFIASQPDAEHHRGGNSGPARPGRPVRRGAMGGPGVRERRVPVHLDAGYRPAALAARHVRPARPARRGERRDIRRRSVLVVPAGAMAGRHVDLVVAVEFVRADPALHRGLDRAGDGARPAVRRAHPAGAARHDRVHRDARGMCLPVPDLAAPVAVRHRTAVKQVSWSTSAGWPPSTTTYTVQTWLQTPSGQRVSEPAGGNNVDAWIAQHHTHTGSPTSRTAT